MAKASIKLPSGATVVIEGSPDEVSSIVGRIERGNDARTKPSASAGKQRFQAEQPRKGGKGSLRRGPTLHVRRLKDEGFFKDSRTLGDVKAKLDAMGYLYLRGQLAVVVLRMVRSEEMYRSGSSPDWRYGARPEDPQ